MRIIVITVNEESERYCHLLDIVSKSLLSSQKTNNNYCILFLIWFLQFIRAVPLKVKTKRYRHRCYFWLPKSNVKLFNFTTITTIRLRNKIKCEYSGFYLRKSEIWLLNILTSPNHTLNAAMNRYIGRTDLFLHFVWKHNLKHFDIILRCRYTGRILQIIHNTRRHR